MTDAAWMSALTPHAAHRVPPGENVREPARS